ncbi:MAG TPA: cell division protein FtsZ [Candidatus Paceibacterota bacterium]
MKKNRKKNKRINKVTRQIADRKKSVKRVSKGAKSGKPKTNLVRMKVVGIGGGGGNMVTRMKEDFRGVEFIIINTDIQDLEKCTVRRKIHIGRILTKGMGAGMNPDLGRLAAEENMAEISEALKDTDIVFLTAGFGGGTGSGALPVIADIARELGVLTVAVVTKPFTFEGSTRMRIADENIFRLKDKVDSLLVIPNDRIFNIIDNETPVIKAFEKIDEILKSAVRGMTEIISSAGLVNVDFADVQSVMSGAGSAVIGVGIASGKERAVKAVNQAINSPLLETSIAGARGVLFCVAGGKDLKMSEVNEAAKIITEAVDPGAKIIFGAYTDRKLKAGQIKITVVAAGFNGIPMKHEDSLDLFMAKERPQSLLDKDVETIVISEEDGGDKKQQKLSNKNQKQPKDNKKTKEEDDIWEIPAFLRRKKR